MEERYQAKTIEEKWQEIWARKNSYRATEDSELPKYYLLEMFPYPSGRIHMGHVRNYSIGDVIARYKRMRGYHVLHPMGWDAFGLPAENAAIESKVHPKIWTEENILYMTNQLKRMGFSYDWDREIATSEPEYYKWNQWFFLKMYERGLAYKKISSVNWCPSCETVLANEQVAEGACWRCDSVVVQKELEQWFFRISAYAEELLRDLDRLTGWPEKVLIMQRNWIGKSVGAKILFPFVGREGGLDIFTTRQDTVYGATFMSLAAEHPMALELSRGTDQEGAVRNFIEKVKNMRQARKDVEEAEKEGVFTGAYCLNPFTREKIPVFVANFVLVEYGTGAIMAVPAHDQRDFEFARKYNIPIRAVIQPEGSRIEAEEMSEAYVEDGIMDSSGPFSEMRSAEGRERINAFLVEKGWGKGDIRFRLRDWGISRQRYWGTPIPILYCSGCGVVPVPEGELPVRLPGEVPLTGKGGSPLLETKDFLAASCPKCKGPARRETDTMDTFVDSSWYFLRYLSPRLDSAPFDIRQAAFWMPVDQYVGGVEHAVMHLLYARFFTKVLRDLGLVRVDEPFTNLLTQGMVCKETYRCEKHGWLLPGDLIGSDQEGWRCPLCGNPLQSGRTEKMSKSKKNIVDPEELLGRYGADTARLFTLFAAPPEKELEWNDQGVEGAHRFLNRLWRFIHQHQSMLRKSSSDSGAGELPPRLKQLRRQIHRTVKKVTDDIEGRFHFNTAIAAMMELFNDVSNLGKDAQSAGNGAALIKNAVEALVVMLYPFVPHIASELWEGMGHGTSMEEVSWPSYSPEALEQDHLQIVVQVDGRVRGKIVVPANADGEIIEERALSDPKVKGFVGSRKIQKVIQVPGRLVNIVLGP